jgi:hypothetical protein
VESAASGWKLAAAWLLGVLVLPRTRYLDWELDDPARPPLVEVRKTRDEIRRRVSSLLAEVDAGKL